MASIGIDARMITSSGIGRYLRCLLKSVMEKDLSNKYILYGRNEQVSKYFPECECKPLLSGVYGLGEQVEMPFRVSGVDLFHAPHYNVPFLVREKMVVTVHDLIHLLFKEFLPVKLAYVYAKWAMDNAVKKASTIIAVSENTKNDIVRNFNVSPDKIKVIYEAADTQAFKKINDPELLNLSRMKYGLPERFIMFLGNIKAHKNLATLVQAFIALKKKKNVEHKLVVVGNADPSRQSRRLADLLERTTDVMFLGNIRTEELVRVFNMAEVFVMPSLYEGFGLPILEAFACEVPVISSNAASLPEVAGDATLEFDPRSVNELKERIWRVITDGNLRNDLVKKGKKRLAQFSWDKTGEQTLEVYKELLG